jgi:very-short-patch-repair endonuclease
MDHLDPVRELVAQCVQTSKATTEAIAAELRTGGSAGSLLTRRALAEVADGVRSVAEAKLYRLLVRRRFPAATWNPDLFDGSGSWLAAPDAIWPEAGLIVEVESREWHLSPESWAATMRRTNRLSRLGYAVQQLPPSRIVAEPEAVVAELRAAYAAGIVRTHAQGRPNVTIRVRGAA